ncbi:hypothetical protein AB0N64_13290 [Microbacterium sp. NPDC089318]
MRRISLAAPAAVLSAAALVLVPAAAQAYTVSPDGSFFVGKGEVQTVMGWNNAQLQTNALSLTFTSRSAAMQELTQSATQLAVEEVSQAGTESAVQSVSVIGVVPYLRQVSCTIDGNKEQQFVSGTRAATRDGERQGTRSAERDGSRTGARSGERTGDRAGTVEGTLDYTIDYKARQQNQFTGFFVEAPDSGVFTETAGTTVWSDIGWGDYAFTGEYNYGEWEFSGDYVYGDPDLGDVVTTGDIEWSGWVNDAGQSSPASCLGGSSKISDLSDTTTVGEFIPGELVATDQPVGGGVVAGDVSYLGVTEGDVTYGEVVGAEVTPQGAMSLYVNGRMLTPTVL